MTWKNSFNAVAWIVLIAALLLGAAGTLDWPQAWIFLAEFVIGGGAVTWWLWRHDPALLKERMGGAFQKGQSVADRIFMTFMVLCWYGWLVLMAFDVKRWGFSHMPIALQAVGALLIPLGFLAVVRVFRENSFAAPVIRIQEERGQRVIDTGPYALVRHPMYSGAFVYLLGMPLVLGSWLGLLVLPLLFAAIILRIFIEERTLREGIPGYADYMARVRWRLVPHVW